jgi:ATP-dependent DNA ligase
LTADDAVLDGEIVVLDGRAVRSANEFELEPICAAFDLVWFNGGDLSNLPLLARKKRLRLIVRKNASRMLYGDHIVEHGSVVRRSLQARHGRYRRESASCDCETNKVAENNALLGWMLGRIQM